MHQMQSKIGAERSRDVTVRNVGKARTKGWRIIGSKNAGKSTSIGQAVPTPPPGASQGVTPFGGSKGRNELSITEWRDDGSLKMKRREWEDGEQQLCKEASHLH